MMKKNMIKFSTVIDRWEHHHENAMVFFKSMDDDNYVPISPLIGYLNVLYGIYIGWLTKKKWNGFKSYNGKLWISIEIYKYHQHKGGGKWENWKKTTSTEKLILTYHIFPGYWHILDSSSNYSSQYLYTIYFHEKNWYHQPSCFTCFCIVNLELHQETNSAVKRQKQTTLKNSNIRTVWLLKII